MVNKDMIDDLPLEDKLKCNYKFTKQDIMSDDGIFLVQCMARDGLTLTEIAEKLGITRIALLKWRKENKDLYNACVRGKQIVDHQVESALLKAALGYQTESVKTTMDIKPDKKGNRTVKVEKTVTEVGPSVTACLAWLNNRKPDQWRKNNRGEVFELEDKYAGVTINIMKAEKREEDTEEDWGNDRA